MSKKIVKYALIGLGSLVATLLLAITVAVAWLSPQRLNALITSGAADALGQQCRLTLGEASLKFWSTFPHLRVNLKSLTLTTTALNALPAQARESLPAGADTIASVDQLDASVSLLPLLRGEICLDHILLSKPRLLLVQADPATANFDFATPSEAPAADSGPLRLPDISIGRFAIEGGLRIRYVSPTDSTDVAITLVQAGVEAAQKPRYHLTLDASAMARVGQMSLEDLQIGIGGQLQWRHTEPMQIVMDDFAVALGTVRADLSGTVDFASDLELADCSVSLSPTPVADLLRLVPHPWAQTLAALHTDGSVSLSLSMPGRYRPGSDALPPLQAQIEVPQCRASYRGLTLKQFALKAECSVEGDSARATLDHLTAIGPGVGFTLQGHACNLLSDPEVDATFKGGIDFSRLPRWVKDMLPAEVEGHLLADCSAYTRLSWLNRRQMHRVRLDGTASLTGFRACMADGSASAYARHATLRLGSNTTLHRQGFRADSLLTVNIAVDTASLTASQVAMQGRGISLGAGCMNRSQSADTSLINPIGASLKAARLRVLFAGDSSRISLTDALVAASLRRWASDSRRPQLKAVVEASRAIYADRLTRASVSKSHLDITLHPAPVRISGRLQARIDSLRPLRPGVSTDSLTAEARAIGRRQRSLRADSAASGQTLSLDADGSLRQLLRQWRARGAMRAARARLFTPYFPLRNTLTDINLAFTTDSVTLTDTRAQVGGSDMLVNGTIANLERALTSRSGRVPLDIFFDLQSDTIDVNQLASAAFAGSAFAQKAEPVTLALSDDISDGAVQLAVETMAATDTMQPLLVPVNVDAHININARHLLYSDLVLKDMTGSLMVYEGAVNLHRLRAHSDAGSLDVSALYDAPAVDALRFAFGLKVNDFYIDRFTRLVPAVDSMMPMLRNISGVINADMAATARLRPDMDIDIPSLTAAVKLEGDSLVLMDAETFRAVSKWLMFKDKRRNMIDHMSVEMVIDSSRLEMFPFMFDIDRYRLGVMGSNDLALNFKYHIAVLRSPLPFKFGINLSGAPDKWKVRLGRARFNEKNAASVRIADTTRINLVNQIEGVFRRGIRGSNLKGLSLGALPTGVPMTDPSIEADTLSAADSAAILNQTLP